MITIAKVGQSTCTRGEERVFGSPIPREGLTQKSLQEPWDRGGGRYECEYEKEEGRIILDV